MGKTVEQTMTNPFMDKSSAMHPLSRNEEEACFKDLKEKALKHCHESVKGKNNNMARP